MARVEFNGLNEQGVGVTVIASELENFEQCKKYLEKTAAALGIKAASYSINAATINEEKRKAFIENNDLDEVYMSPFEGAEQRDESGIYIYKENRYIVHEKI